MCYLQVVTAIIQLLGIATSLTLLPLVWLFLLFCVIEIYLVLVIDWDVVCIDNLAGTQQ